MKRTFASVAIAVAAGMGLRADTVRLNDFVWENSNPEKREVLNVPIEGLKPGMCAEVTMWVDGSGLSEGGVPTASLAWGSRATGAAWVGGSGGTVLRWNDPKIEKDANGRRKILRSPRELRVCKFCRRRRHAFCRHVRDRSRL